MNTNCLAGMECPKCGSEGAFDILGEAMFVVHDDGANMFSELDWDSDNRCHCQSCQYEGKVEDFLIARRKLVEAYAQAQVDSMDADTLEECAKNNIIDKCFDLQQWEIASAFQEHSPDILKEQFPDLA